MAASITEVPRFRKGEKVEFVGGVGTIKSYQVEAGTWTYTVEMAMGPEPEMGRIGAETTVLLNEFDLLQPVSLFQKMVIRELHENEIPINRVSTALNPQ
jgi:hypothetical protein